ALGARLARYGALAGWGRRCPRSRQLLRVPSHRAPRALARSSLARLGSLEGRAQLAWLARPRGFHARPLPGHAGVSDQVLLPYLGLESGFRDGSKKGTLF